MRLVTALAILALTACGEDESPVQAVLVSGHERPVDFTFQPRYVEVHHVEAGWIQYELLTDVDMEEVERGERVLLGTMDLPDGEYDAVRIGYLQALAPPDVVGDVEVETPPRPGRTEIIQDEVWVMQPFCVESGGRDGEIVFSVFTDHPSASVGGPTFKLLSSPDC